MVHNSEILQMIQKLDLDRTETEAKLRTNVHSPITAVRMKQRIDSLHMATIALRKILQ